MKGIKRIGRLIAVLDGLLVVVASVGMLLRWVYPPALAAVVGLLDPVTWEIVLIVGASVLLGVHLWYPFGRMVRSRYVQQIEMQREDGMVSIGVAAIEEPLNRAVRDQPGVVDTRVNVYVERTPRRPVRVMCSVSVLDSPNIPQVVENIRQRLKQRFDEIMPIEEPVHVSVNLRRILREDDRRSRREPDSEPPDEEEPTFQAPQYPVES